MYNNIYVAWASDNDVTIDEIITPHWEEILSRIDQWKKEKIWYSVRISSFIIDKSGLKVNLKEK